MVSSGSRTKLVNEGFVLRAAKNFLPHDPSPAAPVTQIPRNSDHGNSTLGKDAGSLDTHELIQTKDNGRYSVSQVIIPKFRISKSIRLWRTNFQFPNFKLRLLKN